MTIDLQRLRSDADALRAALADAEAQARETRRTLDALSVDTADGAVDADALQAARDAAVAAYEARQASAAALQQRLQAELPAGTAPDALIAGLEAVLPVAMLPVRIETAFVGPDAAPRLRVRLYPDDLHVEQHEPELTVSERNDGIAYWTAVRAGTAVDAAWLPLQSAHGPYRAAWIRDALTPSSPPEQDPPVFPDVPLRRGAWSRPAVASTLPDQFVVRVRVGGWQQLVTTSAVTDRVPMGPDPTRPRDAWPAQPDDPEQVVVIDPALRWMADVDEAEALGLAVTIALPAGTRHVDDVTVVGCIGSLAPDAAAARLAELVRQHRYTRGAAFVEPGTPTNNLADSAAGEAPTDATPQADGQPARTNAQVLARALGLPATTPLAALEGAARGDDDEAGVAQQALFESTWGPYLRVMVQPGFPLARLPALRRHVVAHLRGGAPLPTLRLGRQPYGVLPVLPLSAWQPAAGDSPMLEGLVGLLRRVRPAWSAGVSRVPTGTAAYGHEPVSSRVRLRTPIGNMTRSVLEGVDFGLPSGAEGQLALQERRLLSEIGLQGVRPLVVSQFFAKDAPHLWLPMASPEDLAFSIRGAKPGEAKSVLGLLLRDAARRLSTAVGGGLLAGIDVIAAPDAASAFSARLPSNSMSMTSLSARALSLNPAVAATQRQTYASMAASPVPEAAAGGVDGNGPGGVRMTVDQHIGVLIERHRVDFERYNDADALAAFRDALAHWQHIPPQRWARLCGEVLDTASHRYDAWVSSLALQRLNTVRDGAPSGVILGAWGHVHGITRRDGPDGLNGPVALHNGGHVLAPSLRHAATAGVLRAAWMAHGADPNKDEAPFAVGLSSRRVRQALALADGMRQGQAIGALLGYELERALHEAGPRLGVELDWMIAPLRERFPQRVDAQENATPATTASRLVIDGWHLLQADQGQAAPQSVLQVFDGAVVGLALTAAEVARRRQALIEIVADLDRSLDALADLGLAESAFQMSGRNFERAAAATDMMGRAGRPPDEFEDALSPRPGQGIDQRLLCVFTGCVRPAGWRADSPRAQLAPGADAFVAARLGPIDGLLLRPVDDRGAALPELPMAALRLSALDLACHAAAGTAQRPWGPGMMQALRSAVAQRWIDEGLEPVDAQARAGTAQLRLDPREDRALLDLLHAAAAWHRALAGREPLGASVLSTAQDTPAPSRSGAAVPAALSQAIEALRALGDPAAMDAQTRVDWGLSADDTVATVAARLKRAESDSAAGRQAAAARALWGSDVVVTGSPAADAWPGWVSASLQPGVDLLEGEGEQGAVSRWLQDTARVREAAARLDDAILKSELIDGAGPVALSWSIAQTPVRPCAAPHADRSRWVGLDLPGPLGAAPVTSLAVFQAGDGPVPLPGDGIEGLLLDRWTETVPLRDHAAAATANLPAPDARAPNVVLLAVPAQLGAPWTAAGLLATVDEALALARLRTVDFEAASRVPALLPAIYVEESDLDDFSVRRFVSQSVAEMPRWTVSKLRDGV